MTDILDDIKRNADIFDEYIGEQPIKTNHWRLAAQEIERLRAELEWIRAENHKHLTDYQFQRSDGFKVQGNKESIELVKSALHSHEVVPELRNRLNQARTERDELIKAINLHLSHHEVGCVYLDDAVAKLEDRIND